jgi:phenylalanyl-tRNA synthetase beta chain
MVCLPQSCIFLVTQLTKYRIDPSYLPGHAAAVFLQLADQEPKQIGSFGVMHPIVLKNFELPFPTSTLELNLEYFL